jgi:Bacterial mobilisation protein (MobC)
VGIYRKNLYHFGWQDTEKCDTFFLTIEGQALDPRPAAATTTIHDENPMAGTPSAPQKRRDRVAHIRFSPAEFDAIEAAARVAGMTVSAFVRSLSVEGAGVRPFLGEGDRAVLGLLADGMRAIGGNLNQIARAINTGRTPVETDLAGTIKDVHAVATTVAAELADMTRRSAAIRRGDGA